MKLFGNGRSEADDAFDEAIERAARTVRLFQDIWHPPEESKNKLLQQVENSVREITRIKP